MDLTPVQRRFWLLDRVLGAPEACVEGIWLRLRGRLDRRALELALAAFAARHEPLRTSFAADAGDAGGTPRARVADEARWPLDVVDLTAIAADERERRVATFLRDEPRRAFPLDTAPLARATLLLLAPDDHVLVLAFHHLVTDGVSFSRVLPAELDTLYAAAARGDAPALPPLAASYRDFAAVHAAEHTGDARERHLAFFRDHLGGAPPLEIPTARPRPRTPSRDAGVRTITLPGTAAEDAAALGRSVDATTWHVFLAAFVAWIHRTSGATDVVVGAPHAQRSDPRFAGLFGCLMNTSPVRVRFSSGDTFEELVAHVRDASRATRDHRALGFGELIDATGTGSAPWSVLFNFQTASVRTARLGGLVADAGRLHSGSSALDLGLEVTAAGAAAELTLEHRTDLWSAADADRVLGHIATLLGGALPAPRTPLGDLPLLTAAEERQLRAWNATDADVPAEPTLDELVRAGAHGRGDAAALISGDRVVPHAELQRSADELASRLAPLGARPGRAVAVCAHDPADAVAAFLGVLRAGAAFVPIDPTLPRSRMTVVLEDSGALAIVAGPGVRELLPDGGPVVVDLAVDAGHAAAAIADPTTPVRATPDDPAYILFTSGSTGRPKGVVVRNRNVVAQVGARRSGYGEAPERLLVAHSFAFDAFLGSLIWALAAGRAAIVVADAERRDPARLARLAAAHDVTHVDTVPALYAALLDELPDAGLPDLRAVMIGGEACPRSLVAHHRRLVPHAQLWNEYGPTETTIHSTAHLCAGPATPGGGAPRATAVGAVDAAVDAAVDETDPPIGQPIANTRCHVVDARGRPVPVGVPGELWIGGAGVAAGYVARPEETAARFVPDPFDPRPGATVYRTGDIVRRRDDGALVFVGRVDDQVKIRGHRIELAEVEAAVASDPSVRSVAVSARDDLPGGRGLAAHVVALRGRTIDVHALRARVASRLPAYMTPAAFVQVDELPLTGAGKVDRAALPAPTTDASRDGRGTPPSTPTEAHVASVWAEVLGIEDVGRDDDFFLLGGHSLAAARAASRLRAILRVDAPFSVLLRAPTVRAYAAALDGAARAVADEPIPEPPPGPAPLSFVQERIWYLAQIDPESAAYSIPVALRLRGALDVAALARAVARLPARHESLRTRFVTDEGRPSQVVDDAVSLTVARSDVAAATSPAAAARTRVDALLAEPFDLGTAPLVRAEIVRLGVDDHVLALVVHHSVADGWALDLLVADLARVYAEETGHTRDTFRRDSAPSPRAVAAWQRARATPERTAELVAWWRERLSGSGAPTTLPADRRGGAGAGFVPSRTARDVDSALVVRLRALARERGATLFHVGLAAFALQASRLAGTSDVVLGVPTAGRARRDLEAVVGCLVNTVVVRTHVDGATPVGDLVAQVRDDALAALAHDELPFQALVTHLHPRRSADEHPVFRMFVNHLVATPVPQFGDARAEDWEPQAPPAKFDATLYLRERGAALTLELVVDARRTTAAFAAQIVGQLVSVLRQMADAPGLPSSDVDLAAPIDAGEPGSADPPLDPHRGGRIETAFLAHSRGNPHRVAVVDSHGPWTYARVADASAAIALDLAARGVRPGDVVAIHAERCAALVATMLGVVRAGAAFAVLDAALPAARRARQLDVSGARCLVEIDAAGSLPPELEERARALAARLVVSSRMDASPAAAAAPPPELTDADALAYVAFTSGSTGEPKGVAGDHRPVAHFLAWQAATFGLGPDDRGAALSGIAHDPFLRDVFGPLTYGGSVHVPGRDDVRDPERLVAWLARERVTVAHVTPGLIRLAAAASRAAGALPSLRLVASGGDALRGRDVLLLRAMAPATRVVNFYGTTETPQGVAWFDVPADLADDARVPVGRGIDDVQVLVLRPDGRRCGAGELGEIHVRTPYLSRGYVGHAGADATRFSRAPHAAGAWDRMYRTGDLGRLGADGVVEVARRADRQVKVRGHRVELAEVEGAFERLPGVERAVAVAREGADGEMRIDAHVAHPGEPRPSAASLRAAVRSTLADAAVPAAVAVVAALPLTPNGKVDVARLPEIEPALGPADGDEQPETPDERAIAALWQRLLGVARVRVHDDFFELGGHSLLAARMMAALADDLGTRLPLATLLRAPTVARLAAAVAAARGGTVRRRLLVEIQAGDGRPPLFLVHPIGGHVLFARSLVGRVDPAQPIVGIEARGVDGREPPFESVAEMAAHYVALVRGRQPHGPVWLSGMSFGGNVALEMATLLRARGEDVAFVGLFDSFGPGFPRETNLFTRAADYVRAWWSMPGSERRRRLARHVARLRGRTGPAHAAFAPMDDDGRGRDVAEAIDRVVRANERASAAHVPRPYVGRVHLFRAMRDPGWPGLRLDDPLNGWGRVVHGGVVVVPIDCTHATIFSESVVPQLAAALQACLDQRSRSQRRDDAAAV